MTNENKNQSRRKFISWGVASAALFTAVKFMVPAKKKLETVKMLTQEGKLVEVNIASLPPQKKKVTNDELKNWIKK